MTSSWEQRWRGLWRVWLLVASALVLAQMVVPLTARAADAKPLVLETSPLPINLSVDPGKSVSADLRVKQSDGDTERLKVTLMKFAAFGDEGKPRLLDRGPGDDYFDWVKFDRPVFDAPSNVWQTVHMTITPPKTAAFGYYYAVVFSRVGDDVRQGGRTNSISAGTAVLVLLDVRSPNAKRQLAVEAFGVEHRVYEFLPATFKVTFRNTGNVHAVPHGDVFVTSGKKQLAVLPINASGSNILPASRRIYGVDWATGFPHQELVTEDGKVKLDKNDQQISHLVWSNGDGGAGQPPQIRFGRYTAHLFAVYDDGHRDVPLEADVAFWVIPWRFLLVVLAVMALIGLGVYAAVRRTLMGAARVGRCLRGRH